eukprot:scaffold295507_cov33-Tisochrysis_lutea.AAC.2
MLNVDPLDPYALLEQMIQSTTPIRPTESKVACLYSWGALVRAAFTQDLLGDAQAAWPSTPALGGVDPALSTRNMNS